MLILEELHERREVNLNNSQLKVKFLPQRKHPAFITKINWLVFCGEIIPVCIEVFSGSQPGENGVVIVRFRAVCSCIIAVDVMSVRMMWAGQLARMGEEMKVYKVLVGKPEGKRPLGRARRRWEN
jgi:hypothetical protein